MKAGNSAQQQDETIPLLIPDRSVKWLRLLLLLASCLLVAGLSLPMLTLTKFLFIANSFSVISGIMELLQRDHWFLFVIVGLFSVVLPVIKIVLLFLLLQLRQFNSTRYLQLLKLMHDYGRWGMLDVMVVAVMVVAVKLDVIAEIEIHVGLYLFAAAVLLIMFITHRVAGFRLTQ
ncbi:MAG: paraquat-inducible protein A [Candidatus Thiodiazotropha sp. (ex Ctena orbiculata)]|uniref:Paraquat-inducible protein A n=1 Tax=Candidatus Thiodiazotropha taylori TaxID=2792791 RepID=A0A944M7K7_9GAMM|nr:paraquat-inducible protein A [Candidatus Thiodiazotropha taylori]